VDDALGSSLSTNLKNLYGVIGTGDRSTSRLLAVLWLLAEDIRLSHHRSEQGKLACEAPLVTTESEYTTGRARVNRELACSLPRACHFGL